MNVVIASGTGRYSDPWHAFAETSECIAVILRDAGHEVTVNPDVDAALAALAGIDVLVVNAGDPWRNASAEPAAVDALAAAEAGLRNAVERGIGVLAMHNALSSLRDYPLWHGLLGGEWVPGVSMHPDIAATSITVGPVAHPITAGQGDIELIDERYSWLDLDEGVVALADHELDGRRHPLLWARAHGRARVVVDALGHDRRSFDAEAHREIIRRSVAWLAGAN